MIVDLHNDLLTGCEDKMSQLLLYKQLNVRVICAYFRGGNTLAKAICDVNKFMQIKSENCYLAFEDIGYTCQDRIDSLFQFLPIYVSLTWNGENNLGFGCDYNDKDLKVTGVKLINKINSYKIAVDCAHLSRKGFYTLIDKSENVLCSHTAFDKIFNHKRNITEEQIKLLLEKKGVIGLTLYSPFITNKEIGSVEDFIKHIDYFVNKFGFEGLCLGSDFFGAKNFISNINNYQNLIKIVEKLEKIGYNKKAIDAIFYKNALKFINKVKKLQKSVKI